MSREIIADAATPTGTMSVIKQDDIYSVLMGEEVKHPDSSAEDVIRALAHYLHSTNYKLQKALKIIEEIIPNGERYRSVILSDVFILENSTSITNKSTDTNRGGNRVQLRLQGWEDIDETKENPRTIILKSSYGNITCDFKTGEILLIEYTNEDGNKELDCIERFDPSSFADDKEMDILAAAGWTNLGRFERTNLPGHLVDQTFAKNKFYIVYSPEGNAPAKVQHRTKGAALWVARRMAALHPGQTFYVMKSASKPITGTVSEAPVDNTSSTDSESEEIIHENNQ